MDNSTMAKICDELEQVCDMLASDAKHRKVPTKPYKQKCHHCGNVKIVEPKPLPINLPAQFEKKGKIFRAYSKVYQKLSEEESP